MSDPHQAFGQQPVGGQYGQNSPQYPPNQYGNQFSAAPRSGYQASAETGQQPGYFPQHQGSSQAGPGDGAIGGLASQMGGLGLGGGDPGAAVAPRPHKKKDRHAYHTLEAPAGSSQPFNGIPQGGAPAPNQFFDPNAPQPPQPSPGFQQTTPAPGGSQFQKHPNAPFNPVSEQNAANDGFGPTNPAITAAGPPGSAQGRVDPDQIPSVPRSRDGPAAYYQEHVFPTLENHLPPPAAIPFLSYDQGNSSPKFTRLTVNNIPSTSDVLASTGLPLGLLLQPLAALQPGEQPIPVLDFGESGPPRCRRCRAYINPFMTFRSGGNRFVCNMCTFPNEVPPEYFSPTNPQGVRVDREQRPELMRGTVEFMVPKEYWAKEPVGIRWLFVIDVTQEAVTKGFIKGFCKGIMSALYGDDETSQDESADGEETTTKRTVPQGSKVGIITFDRDIHFYNLTAGLDQAQMMVMPDVEDPFTPLSEGLFVDPYESKSVIVPLLKRLPSLFSKIKNPEPALLPALNSALAALSLTGGKVICSISALPTSGPGRLHHRDDGKLHGTDAEKKLFQTEHPGWTKAASKAVESGVGVDFFIASSSGLYMDVATIGHVSALSGGETFYYPNYYSPRDNHKLSEEIKHTVTRETGYQALLKVRCSTGLQVSSYHGNFLQHTFGADLEFGSVDADKAIGVLFSYDGKLDSKLDAHFQSALLYTTAGGERRVRCCNVVASVSDGGMESMRFVDQDAVVNIIAKEAASKMTERLLKDIRGGLTEKTVDILAGYRKNFSGSHPPGQLVLPENLKEFSMYMLSLIKSRPFKGGTEPTDRRVHEMRLLKSMGAMEMSLYLYPRVIALHNLSEEHGFPNEQGYLRLPPTMRASFSRVHEGGAYLVDNGQICLLWLHAQVSPNLLVDLFGDEHASLQSLDPFMHTLPVLETHLNAQVRNIVQYLCDNRGSKALTIQLARQGLDGAEYEFARLLVEDRNNEAQSYVDWLVHVHRHIQLELSGQRKKDDSSDGGSLANFTGLRPPYW